MKKIILFLISPLLLTLSVSFSKFSGNDKAPIFILFTLVTIFVIFIVTAIISLARYKQISNTKFICFGALFTLIYVVVVVSLSRSGIVDSNTFLGFR